MRAIVDEGPLVAFFDKSERYHHWTGDWIAELDAPLLVCEPVLTETIYLLARFPKAQDALFGRLQNGALAMSFRLQEHIGMPHRRLRNYRDTPMSLADACVVRMAETYEDHSVPPLDPDITVYRKHGRRPLTLMHPAAMPGCPSFRQCYFCNNRLPGPAMSHAQPHEPDIPMTREEFLAWLDHQPSGRFERIDGIVVAMAPERASHNLRKGAARDALRRAMANAGLTSCQAFTGGMSVQVGNNDFQPDAILRSGPRLPDDSTRVPDPLVIVEVLSPDSGTGDRATKLRAYFRLPSVQHYLIVWPEEHRIVRHSRMPDGQLATQVFVSGEISLNPPGITVTAEEFYLD